MNWYFLSVFGVLFLLHLASALERQEFAWIQNGSTFQGLSKIWAKDDSGPECVISNIKPVKCIER